MKHLFRLTSLSLSLFLMLSAVSCDHTSIETTTEVTTASLWESTTSSDTSSQPTSAEMTTDVTASSLSESTPSADDPISSPPDYLLREGDTVTEAMQIESVRMHGGDDKRYTVRIALLDVNERERSGKGCYFDVVDPETNTVITHKRLLGASTLSYYIDSTYHTLTISTTSVAFDTQYARLSISSSKYSFSCLTEIGLSTEPQFLGLSAGESFSQAVENTPRVLDRLNGKLRPFLPTMSKKLLTDADDFTYLMSNDSSFLAYCGEQTPTVTLLFSFWDKIKDLTDFLEEYKLW